MNAVVVLMLVIAVGLAVAVCFDVRACLAVSDWLYARAVGLRASREAYRREFDAALAGRRRLHA